MYERIKVYYIYVYIQNLSQLLKNKHSECSHFLHFSEKVSVSFFGVLLCVTVLHLHRNFVRHKVVGVGHGDCEILIVKSEALFGYASYKLDYPAVYGGRLGVLVRLKRENSKKSSI